MRVIVYFHTFYTISERINSVQDKNQSNDPGM